MMVKTNEHIDDSPARGDKKQSHKSKAISFCTCDSDCSFCISKNIYI